MESLEQIRDRILARFPGASVELVPNPGVAAEHSLLLGPAQARAIAVFLRDDPALQFDFCSNVTGVDWPDKEIIETRKVSVPATETGAPSAGAGGADPGPKAGPATTPPATKVIEEKIKRLQPGYLEAVYHLYSMALRHGPLVLRQRTPNRQDQVTVPSLTPVWRSADFQEREAFDLFGLVFEGHPDLRRILMWDEFKDHPMRKDYVAPDDYEWEPTPHGEVLERARKHYPTAPAAGVASSVAGGADPGRASPVAGGADTGPASSKPATVKPSEARP